MHALCNDTRLQAFPGRHHLLTLGTTFLHGFRHRFRQDPEEWGTLGTFTIRLLGVLLSTSKLSSSHSIQVPACNVTTVLADIQPSGPAFLSTTFSAAGSQMRTERSPIFIPGSLASDVFPNKHAHCIFGLAV